MRATCIFDWSKYLKFKNELKLPATSFAASLVDSYALTIALVAVALAQNSKEFRGYFTGSEPTRPAKSVREEESKEEPGEVEQSE